MDPFTLGVLKYFFLLVVLPFAVTFAFVIYGFFANDKDFIREVIPYYSFLYEKYGSKHPVRMYGDIETSFFEILHTDRKKAYIFFTEEALVITKIHDPSYEYVILKENILNSSYMFYQSRDQYYIRISFLKDNERHKISFETDPLFYNTRKFVREYRDIIGAEGFLKELHSITNTASRTF